MEMPVPGTLFQSRYRLERLLGTGRSAEVFLASDTHAERSVAVKVLRPDDGTYDPRMRARHEREVQLVARLRSPHAVRLFEYGHSVEGLLFLVFEFVPGRDLSNILEVVGALDDTVTAHILRQILMALYEAHDLGLLHRDIKPENIRVFEYMGDPWCAKLLDFGGAKDLLADTGARLTQTGALIGSPLYMSPEQLGSEQLTPSSDLYSLGVTACEMLLGSAAMNGAEIGGRFDALAQLHAGDAPGSRGNLLRDVVARLVARERADRFQTAAEVVAAIDTAVGGVGVAPAPQSGSTETAPRDARHRAAETNQAPAAALFVGLLVGVLLVGTLLLLAYPSFDDPEPVPLVTPAGPRANPLAAPTIEDIGGHVDSSHQDTAPAITVRRSIGCGNEPTHHDRQKMTDERGRQVTVFIPTTYDKEAQHPVVLMFHEAFETDSSLFWDSRIRDVAEKNAFIVAAPRDPFFGDWLDPGDINAAGDALNLLEANFCIDVERIYAIGNGAGAALVEKLACKMPEIRAFATMSYRSPENVVCEDRAAIPYIHFTALKDRSLAPDGNGCGGPVPTLAAHERRWQTRNACGTSRLLHSKWEQNRCWTWDCRTPFVSCKLDAGRGWPGREQPRQADVQGCDGSSLSEYDMSGTIWSFFAATAVGDDP